MAQKDRAALNVQADEIKNEVTTDANTATRVGQMLNDLVDSQYNLDDDSETTNNLLTGTSLGLWKFLGNNLPGDPNAGEYLNTDIGNIFKVHKLDINGNDNSGTFNLYSIGDLFGFVYPENNTERFYYELTAIALVGDIYEFTFNASAVLMHLTAAQVIGNNYIISAYFKGGGSSGGGSTVKLINITALNPAVGLLDFTGFNRFLPIRFLAIFTADADEEFTYRVLLQNQNSGFEYSYSRKFSVLNNKAWSVVDEFYLPSDDYIIAVGDGGVKLPVNLFMIGTAT